MLAGRVVGHGITTVKHESLRAAKLLLVQPESAGGEPDGEPLLAIDHLGAGVGHRVILTSDGEGTRQAVGSKNSPARWLVLGVCD